MSMSRRRILATLAAAGGAGALSGTGASALFRDREGVNGRLTTGIVDVVGEYWLLSGPGFDGDFDRSDPDGVVDGPQISVPIGTLDEDRTRGSMLFRFALPQPDGAVNNPVSLWLRTECPPSNALAEFLEVRLSYASADGTRGATITRGSLREVTDALRTGYRLDPAGDPTDGTPDCLTDELFVLVEYDLGEYVGTATTGLPLFIAAVQCRNAGSQSSPFPDDAIDTPCEEALVCDCCQAIGKVEISGPPFQVGSTYGFTEGTTDYALRVTGVDGNAGVAFELIPWNGQTVPPLCEVQVKGGSVDEIYSRHAEEFGFDTAVLEGTSDGLVYAPMNPNSGQRYDISYVLVKVCAPSIADGSCPEDLVRPAATSGQLSKSRRPAEQSGGKDE